MKRTLTLLGLSLMLTAAPLFAQKAMDQANEKAVQITQGPNITNISGTSATINWTTNSSAANHVRYRVAGSNSAWQTATHPGGGTSHSLQLTGLQPGKTYEWQILTTDGDLRTSGQFQSAATAAGTAPDVNSGAATAGAAPSTGTGDVATGPKVPLYRSVSTTNDGHLYTTNAGEENANGFRAEGVSGYVMSSQGSGTVPLYKLTNAKKDTILTTDANFRAQAQSQGYTDGGIVGYVASSQQPGTEPLYQLSSSDGASHLYTTNSGERGQIIGKGWRDQGTIGYVWTQQ